MSDGFGFFIEPALAALGVPWISGRDGTTRGSGRAARRSPFPNGNPQCFVCGTCKRNRVLAHQAAGRRVVFIGDGESDRYAAGYADVVFAKHSLERFCLERGWPFQRWTAFSEIHRWLDGQLGRSPRIPRHYPGPRRAAACSAARRSGARVGSTHRVAAPDRCRRTRVAR